jgi:hypothetical protein
MTATPSKVIKYALYTGLIFPPLQLQSAETDQSNKAIQATPPRQQGKEEKTREQCGAKRYCNEMASCEEARFYLTQCGRTRLDRDEDGVPCESLCR